ncbi:hypothetical protein ACFVWY_03455 [Streptomyces sp. NPDC058195]|uniref:hypothetical protein n=1 Tax=Streptomyces sp. NPDC058195 TaxID=3346375 RepID=UPI0036E8BAAC
MADERYEWLDKDAAERLLRGEPVDPVDGPSGTDAERLAAALEAAARTARPATAELPGEAAALAAFRATPRARAARGAADRLGGPADRAGVLDPVRLGSGPAAGAGRGRRARWSRPVRFGLVASFAGCALGGVAVAAGTGMLQVPFGGGSQPASSVSAAATPEEPGPERAEGLTAPPSASPDASGATSSAGSSSSAGAPEPGGPDRSEGRDHGKGDGSGARTSGPPTGSADGRPDSRPGNSGSAGWYAKAVQACRDYRDGTLNEKRRRKLEELANGAANLGRFCDRVLGANEDGQNGNGQGGGSGGGGQNNEGSDRGTGDDQGEDEEGDRGSGIGYTTTPSPADRPGGTGPSGAPGTRPVRRV